MLSECSSPPACESALTWYISCFMCLYCIYSAVKVRQKTAESLVRAVILLVQPFSRETWALLDQIPGWKVGNSLA